MEHHFKEERSSSKLFSSRCWFPRGLHAHLFWKPGPQKWRPLQAPSAHQISGPSSFWITATLYPWGFSKMCLRRPQKIWISCGFDTIWKTQQSTHWTNSTGMVIQCDPLGANAETSLTSAMLSFQLPTRQWGRSLECESGQAKALETFQTQTSLGIYLSVVVDSHKAKKKLCKLRIASPTHSWPECFKTLHINQFRKYNRFCQQESLPGKERTGWDSHWKLPFHIVGLHKVLNENDMDLFLRVK